MDFGYGWVVLGFGVDGGLRVNTFEVANLFGGRAVEPRLLEVGGCRTDGGDKITRT